MNSTARKTVIFIKTGNLLVIDPAGPEITAVADSVLSFDERKVAQGPEAASRAAMGLSPVEIVRHTLYETDIHGRVATMYGFWHALREAFTARGCNVKLRVMDPPLRHPRLFEPVMANVARYTLKEGQPEFLQAVLKSRCGRISCPPGFGKSFMIGIIASVFPRAKIDVVTRRVAVLRERIYPELVTMLDSVGIVGGGKKITGRRVMCYTVGSLDHSPATADILIGDEAHELAADDAASRLVRWQNSRNYGLSASHDMRFDGKDKRLEGIFGPIILNVSYQEAQAGKLVVPIEVKWRTVRMSYDPGDGLTGARAKKARIWRNEVRNRLIAEDAKAYGDDEQVLITCETIDHAMHLKKFLPDYTLMYNPSSMSVSRRQTYAALGCCNTNEILMDDERRIRLTKDFEAGRLKKVIATPVWNVGVSFNSLAVLIRAEGASSDIASVQIPGRVSRTAEGKDGGVVHDYFDTYSDSTLRKSKQRSKIYKANGWKQTAFEGSLVASFLE